MKIFRRPYLIFAKRVRSLVPSRGRGLRLSRRVCGLLLPEEKRFSAERKCWPPLAEMRMLRGRSECVRSGVKRPDIRRLSCPGPSAGSGRLCGQADRGRRYPKPGPADSAGGEDMLWDPKRLFDLVILRERASQQVEVVRQSVEVGQRIGADRGVECCGAQAGAFGAAADRAADVT